MGLLAKLDPWAGKSKRKDGLMAVMLAWVQFLSLAQACSAIVGMSLRVWLHCSWRCDCSRQAGMYPSEL